MHLRLFHLLSKKALCALGAFVLACMMAASALADVSSRNTENHHAFSIDETRKVYDAISREIEAYVQQPKVPGASKIKLVRQAARVISDSVIWTANVLGAAELALIVKRIYLCVRSQEHQPLLTHEKIRTCTKQVMSQI